MTAWAEQNEYDHRYARTADSYAAIASGGAVRNHETNVGMRASVAGNYTITPRNVQPGRTTVADIVVNMLAGETFAIDVATVKETPASGTYIILYP